MSRFHDDDALAAEVAATPLEDLQRDLREAGMTPVDAAQAYPKAFAYFAAKKGAELAANDKEDRQVRMAAFDGRSDNRAAGLGDAPGAGLLGRITGVSGSASLVLAGGVVELHLDEPAAISTLSLGHLDYCLSGPDKRELVYVIGGLAEDVAYFFCFDHESDPACHPVRWC